MNPLLSMQADCIALPVEIFFRDISWQSTSVLPLESSTKSLKILQHSRVRVGWDSHHNVCGAFEAMVVTQVFHIKCLVRYNCLFKWSYTCRRWKQGLLIATARELAKKLHILRLAGWLHIKFLFPKERYEIVVFAFLYPVLFWVVSLVKTIFPEPFRQEFLGNV